MLEVVSRPMVVARHRRRRRPVLPALALLVTILVLVASAVSSDDGGPDARLSYVDQVRPLVRRSNEAGLELNDVRSLADRLTRAALTRRLDRLAAEARALAREGTTAEAPPGLRAPHGLRVATLEIRAKALARMRPALEEALGSSVSSGPAVSGLVAVGADLVLADRTFQLFFEGLRPADRRTLERSQWVREVHTWQAGDLSAFVARLRSSAALGPVHDVAVVTLATEPPAAAVEGPMEVLPIARVLALQVVVANVGNEPERRVEVVATVTSATGAADSARQFADLEPGQRVALRLGGLVVNPEGPWTLQVRVGPVPGELGVADNEVTRPFLMR